MPAADHDPSDVVTVRPSRARRWCCAPYIAVSLAWLAWSIGRDTYDTVAFSVLTVAVCIVAYRAATSVVTISPDGIRSRNVLEAYVPASEVLALDLAGGRWGLTRKITVAVTRTDGRRMLLPQITMRETPSRRADLEARVDAWRCILGVDPARATDVAADVAAAEAPQVPSRPSASPPTLPM